MKLIQRFMRFFFRLLYHPFAFTYDLVAATVSFGNWKNWVFSILPFIEGTRILELGHGPGHLQRLLINRGLFAVAIDESTQMGRIAKRRLGPSHTVLRSAQGKLTRGLAQALPYQNGAFDTIIATFPSEYIFDLETFSEARRVLRNSGRFIVLLAAWPKNPFLAWLYKVTGESPLEVEESIKSKIKERLAHAEFKVEVEIVEVKSSRLLIIVAQRK
jgi:ubiquinone/menaquinone biosynthesis C-methylase UbiE